MFLFPCIIWWTEFLCLRFAEGLCLEILPRYSIARTDYQKKKNSEAGLLVNVGAGQLRYAQERHDSCTCQDPQAYCLLFDNVFSETGHICDSS
jgi:hypothetical protein